MVHFAGSIVVPDSVRDPLGYYLNNTVKSRMLMACAVKAGIPRFIFSSTAAVYGNLGAEPVFEDAAARTRLALWLLQADDRVDAEGFAQPPMACSTSRCAISMWRAATRKGRIGQSTPRATHLIKVACQTALGQRERLEVFGTDYDTPDGTCLRDYIHVSDLIAAHVDALAHLRRGGDSGIFNCGYGKGYSVLEVIKAVERANGAPLPVTYGPRRAGDPAAIVAGADRVRQVLGWQPKYENLDFIVETALDWERKLAQRNAAAEAWRPIEAAFGG